MVFYASAAHSFSGAKPLPMPGLGYSTQEASEVASERSWCYSCPLVSPRDRIMLNAQAMRDQKFQKLMVSTEEVTVTESHDTLSETPTSSLQAHTRPDLDQELDKQAPFQRYIKQHTPSRKPSPALIQSIKDRIKVMEFHD